jgi:hypothetical protein
VIGSRSSSIGLSGCLTDRQPGARRPSDRTCRRYPSPSRLYEPIVLSFEEYWDFESYFYLGLTDTLSYLDISKGCSSDRSGSNPDRPASLFCRHPALERPDEIWQNPPPFPGVCGARRAGRAGRDRRRGGCRRRSTPMSLSGSDAPAEPGGSYSGQTCANVRAAPEGRRGDLV